jgi:hypothetical protein
MIPGFYYVTAQKGILSLNFANSEREELRSVLPIDREIVANTASVTVRKWSSFIVVQLVEAGTGRTLILESRDQGYSFSQINIGGKLSSCTIKLQAKGVISCIDKESIYLMGPQFRQWYSFPIPDNLRPLDVSLNEREEVFVLAAPVIEITAELSILPGILYKEKNEWRYEQIKGTRSVGSKLTSRSMIKDTACLDACETPHIIVSPYYSLVDEILMSDFPTQSIVVVRDHDYCHCEVIKSEICSIVREEPGHVSIFAGNNRIYRWLADLHRWKSEDLRSALKRGHGEFSIASVQSAIVAAAGRGDNLLILIAMKSKKRIGKLEPNQTCVITSVDRGRSFDVFRVSAPGDSEILAVSLD